MRVNVPFELLFGIGILLFTFSVFIYVLIIKRLLSPGGHRGIWVLPIIGVVFLLGATVIHFIGCSFMALGYLEPILKIFSPL